MTLYILAYIFLSIVFSLLCIYIYKTNKFILSLVLTFLYLFTFTSWGYPFTIILFIFIITTVILQLKDFLTTKDRAKKILLLFKGIIIFLTIIVLMILALPHIRAISVGKIHYLIDKFNFISILVSLSILFEELNDGNKKNEEFTKWQHESLKLKNDINIYLEELKEELPEFLKEERIFISNKINERMTLYITQENLDKYLKLKKTYTDAKKKMPKSIYNHMRMFGATFSMIVICIIFIISINKNYTVLDVPSLIKLEYNVDNYVSDVSLLPLWDYKDREGVEEKLSELGYIKDDMISTLKDYYNYDAFDLQSVSTDISFSPSTNLQQNDEVNIKFNYDYNIAKKSQLKIKNPYFTTTPKFLKASITQEEYETNYLSEWEVDKALEAKLDEEKIKYSQATITSEKILIDSKDNYNVSYLTFDVSLDGTKGDKEINDVTYKVEIFYQNDELRINPNNSTLEY